MAFAGYHSGCVAQRRTRQKYRGLPPLVEELCSDAVMSTRHFWRRTALFATRLSVDTRTAIAGVPAALSDVRRIAMLPTLASVDVTPVLWWMARRFRIFISEHYFYLPNREAVEWSTERILLTHIDKHCFSCAVSAHLARFHWFALQIHA